VTVCSAEGRGLGGLELEPRYFLPGPRSSSPSREPVSHHRCRPHGFNCCKLGILHITVRGTLQQTAWKFTESGERRA